MARGGGMTHCAQLLHGYLCACLPMLAWSTDHCTDYSDSLNFSLTSLSHICCGKHLSISPSVRLSLLQAWHRFAMNGMPCASVRSAIRKFACLHFSHAGIGFSLSTQFLSTLRSIYQTFISMLAFNHIHFYQKGVVAWQ